MKKQTVLSMLVILIASALLFATVFLVYNFIVASVEVIAEKAGNNFSAGSIAVR